MYKVDLHTHSIDSPDGGITSAQYRHVLSTGLLDCIAITDHGSIAFAKKLRDEVGDKIIVGQEIMTSDGEIIGLYLKEKVPAKLTPIDAIKAIKEQDGLVYVPHPLETRRHGLQINILDELTDDIDIIEVGNGRSLLQYRYTQMLVWANLNHVAIAASSDAHGKVGLGHTYTSVTEIPTKSTLLKLLLGGTPNVKRPTVRALLYPKYNRAKGRYS